MNQPEAASPGVIIAGVVRRVNPRAKRLGRFSLHSLSRKTGHVFELSTT